MKLDTRVYPDLEALSRGALEHVLGALRDAVTARGRFAIALSGGHTPAKMYALWAEQYAKLTPWDRVHVFWSDERYVPQDDLLSNYRMARETLLSHVPIPPSNVHPFATNLPQPEQVADACETDLRKFFGAQPPEFDVQLLGLGVEGHTASLFPNSSALDEKKKWVMAVRAPADPPQRLTFTPVVLNRGRNTYFLAAGKDKQEILRKIENEPDSRPSEYPAARLRPSGRELWFLDQAAAG
jgi:6-phosphogluconolactonase